MTAYVLTLIGNLKSVPLEPVHVERVYQRLATVGETGWLAEREACDLFIDSPHSAVDIAEQARGALSGTAIDTVCTATEIVFL